MIRNVVLAALAISCGSKAPDHPPAKIIDLSTGVRELRDDFDAHSGEARFVTLLSPT